MKEDLGNFKVDSGSILISDPCYDDAEYMHIVVEAHNGEWDAFVEEYDDNISKLGATLVGTNVGYLESKGVAGVDSGQMGIYDEPHFDNKKSVKKPLFDFGDNADHSKWYRMCCERTLNSPAGVIPHGVVSSSGWGDGAYDVKVSKLDGKVNHIEIIFIYEGDEE